MTIRQKTFQTVFREEAVLAGLLGVEKRRFEERKAVGPPRRCVQTQCWWVPALGVLQLMLWLAFRVGIGGVCRDDVADPSQRSPATYPETRCNDQPEDGAQELT